MSLNFYVFDERTLSIITERGVITQLHVPFQVRSLHSIERIKEGMLVSVEGVADHSVHKIVYRILNQWHPYNDFMLLERF